MSDIERKLATIRKISAIDPIPDADAIEVATVDGWKIVVKKGEYQVDDLVVYVEIDSFIPTELAPFLSKGKEPREYNGVKGERLRTVKLRGQISQGLILPLFGYQTVNVAERTVENHPGLIEKFATYENVANRPYPVWIENITEEEFYIMPDGRCDSFIYEIDLSERLGIQKYEAPIPACLAGTVRGNFPSFIPKTDQERIQNLSKKFELFKQYIWEITEKLDGSSCTFYFNNGDFGVCSRNLDLKEDYNNTFWKMAAKYDVETNMEKYGKNLAIQGEIIGEGIQGNPYKIQGQRFFVFDIYDIDNGVYYQALERKLICGLMELEHVPTIIPGYKLPEEFSVDNVLQMAEDKSKLNEKTEREGIVFKCIENPDLSFKAISNRFLLKSGD